MLGLPGNQLLKEEGGREGGVEGGSDVEGEERGHGLAELGVEEGGVVVGAALRAHFIAESEKRR